MAQGDVDALGLYGDVRLLPPDVASALMASDATQVEAIISEATGHGYGFRFDDPAQRLGLLCTWFPAQAGPHWALIFRFLADPRVAGEHKVGLCELLTARAQGLDDGTRARLAEIAPNITEPVTPMPGMLGRPLGGAAAVLSLAVGAGTESDRAAAISRLLTGTSRHRRDAIKILSLRNQQDESLALIALLGDGDPWVRADAAGALTYRLSQGFSDDLTPAALNLAVDDPGVLVPLAIATNADSPSAPIRQLTTRLLNHPSAAVRSRVTSAHGS